MKRKQFELVGLYEISKMADTDKKTVTGWRYRYKNFPKAFAELQTGPIWKKESIESWLKNERMITKGTRTIVENFEAILYSTNIRPQEIRYLQSHVEKWIEFIKLSPKCDDYEDPKCTH